MNKRRLIGYFCLLLYLLTWISSAQAIPLLLAGVGHGHQIFLTYHDNKVQVALHHPGYPDAHEPSAATPLEAYQHDLLDKVLWALSDQADHGYADHVIDLPLDKQPILVTTKKIDSKKTGVFLDCSFPAIASPLSGWAGLARGRHLGQPPPDIPSIPLHLRTTVLLN